MNNVVYVQLAGRNIPLKFSIRAADKIAEKYESTEKWIEKMDSVDMGERMRAYVDGIAAMSEAGAAYLDMMRENHDALFEYSDFELILDWNICANIFPKMREAITGAQKRTVDIEEEPSKNEEPTPEN